ncbi:MAG: T9SS type A sorting domain-containing protein [Bacteroidia bacterium]
MKKLLFLSAAIAYVISLPAQTLKEKHYADGSFYKPCAYVKETKPLKELIAERDAKRKSGVLGYPHPSPDGPARERFNNKNKHQAGANVQTTDGARQSTDGTIKTTSSLILNFDGQPSLQGGYPMDPNGMIGSKYYVQTVNSSYEAWDKSGNVYIAQTDLYNLFGSIGAGDCGDPVTIYDKAADRWIITEFEGCTNATQDIDTLLMAVSETNDPAGKYWLYAFVPNIGSFDDYPKYNVWGDGYYMTCNCETPDMVVAYQRDSMLKGSSNAGMIAMPWNNGPYNTGSCGGNFFCPMMLDCDGSLPPYGSPEYLFYYWDDNWGCGGADSICIEQVSVNWATQTGTINGNYQHLTTTAFNSNFSGGFDGNLPQPGNNTTQYLASLDGFFSYRIPYLRWSSYNSAVMVNPVSLGTAAAPVSGLRWYELRQDTTTKMWSIYQQSTYGPNDGVSRWNASIAMDQNGNIGLSYNVTDPTSIYPGCRYTGRRACDPLDSMTISEVTAVNGNALAVTPENGGNRWGDYSHLSVDPVDGITFWHTNMYASSSFSTFGENIGTRIYSYQIPKCVSGVDNISGPVATLTASQNGETLNIIGNNLPESERVVVELFDINGKRLMQQAMLPSGNVLKTSFDVSSLAKAIYIVRLGNDSFQRIVKVDIH